MRLQAKSTTGETFRGSDTQRFLASVKRRLLQDVRKHRWDTQTFDGHGAALAHCTVRHILKGEMPCAWCSKWLDTDFRWKG